MTGARAIPVPTVTLSELLAHWPVTKRILRREEPWLIDPSVIPKLKRVAGHARVHLRRKRALGLGGR